MATGDPHYASVTLALHCDGADGSTTLTDTSASPRTVTLKPGTAVSPVAKFGTGSAKTVAAGGFSLPSEGVSNFGAGDFTVEFQLQPVTAAGFFCGMYNATTNAASFYWSLAADGTVSFLLLRGAGDSFQVSSPAGLVVPGAFKHIAASRNGAALRLFVEGALVGSADLGASFTVWDTGVPLNFGMIDPGAVYTGEAYFDDIRITKGVGRYVAAFTPPAEAFADSVADTGVWTVSGVVRDGAGVPCARTVRAYARSTGALLGSTTSDAATGAYSLPMAAQNPVTVLALPANGEALNALVLDNVTPA